MSDFSFLLNWPPLDYAGKVKVCEVGYEGSISQVAIHLPQTFHKIHSQSHIELPEARFTYFIENVIIKTILRLLPMSCKNVELNVLNFDVCFYPLDST